MIRLYLIILLARSNFLTSGPRGFAHVGWVFVDFSSKLLESDSSKPCSISIGFASLFLRSLFEPFPLEVRLGVVGIDFWRFFDSLSFSLHSVALFSSDCLHSIAFEFSLLVRCYIIIHYIYYVLLYFNHNWGTVERMWYEVPILLTFWTLLNFGLDWRNSSKIWLRKEESNLSIYIIFAIIIKERED